MKCRSPIQVSTSPVPVPCGQCIACRIQRRDEWACRLMLEAQANAGASLFVTLTVQDEHQALSPSGRSNLQRDFVSRFMKRLRFNTGLPLRFLGCGEYGERNERAHYHLCLFGLPVDWQCSWAPSAGEQKRLRELVGSKWEQYSGVELEVFRAHQCAGHVQVAEFNSARAAYTVATYTVKCAASSGDWGDRVPPFLVMSRRPALGTVAVSGLAESVKLRGGYPAGMDRYAPPSGGVPSPLSHVAVVGVSGYGAAQSVGGASEGMSASAVSKRFLPLGRTLRQKLLAEWGPEYRSPEERHAALLAGVAESDLQAVVVAGGFLEAQQSKRVRASRQHRKAMRARLL